MARSDTFDGECEKKRGIATILVLGMTKVTLTVCERWPDLQSKLVETKPRNVAPISDHY